MNPFQATAIVALGRRIEKLQYELAVIETILGFGPNGNADIHVSGHDPIRVPRKGVLPLLLDRKAEIITELAKMEVPQ